MNRSLNLFLIVVIIIILLIFSGTIYIVDETQQAVITQFGEPIGRPISKAGLYFKIPFIQVANYFEKRILTWDGDPNQIPTRDKKYIWVDTTARWRISDALKFMESVRTEASAQSRLDDIIDSATRDIISGNKLVEAVRDDNRLLEKEHIKNEDKEDIQINASELESIEVGRDNLAKQILEVSSKITPKYGIELIDVKIKRINYIQEVREKVYERMISERKLAAEKFRSEGQGKKAEMQGQITKELEQIQSEAYRTAQEIMGKADAEAIKIYANAYEKDPEFYSFVKTLESYKKTINNTTSLILTTNNEYYEQFIGKKNLIQQ